MRARVQLSEQLAAELCAALGGAAAVDAEWERRLAAACARWPALDVDARAFTAYASARLATVRAWDGFASDDLYLAFACVGGDEQAFAALDAGPLAGAAALLGRRFGPDVLDEARQVVRTLLFSPRRDGTGGLESYGGRGALGGWLRVTLAREALRLCRRPSAHDLG